MDYLFEGPGQVTVIYLTMRPLAYVGLWLVGVLVIKRVMRSEYSPIITPLARTLLSTAPFFRLRFGGDSSTGSLASCTTSPSNPAVPPGQ